MPRVKVNLGKRSYFITCVSDDYGPLRTELSKKAQSGRLFILFDANAFALHGKRFIKSLRLPSKSVYELILPSGERYKNQKELSALQSMLLEKQIERNDFILAVGGGVTTDICGYVAASLLRGIRWGAVPTTLLGMVDAAIGGKTGINHPLGKNLIGAIWQPSFVHCDTLFLHTLPRRQIMAGCGEILKYAGLMSGPLADTFNRYLQNNNLYDSALLRQLILASVRCKARIVSEDESEAGKRMILNYGHTFGHAIENALGYGRLLHGEAIILGIYAALELGKLSGIEKNRSCENYRQLVIGMMAELPRRKLSAEAVMAGMGADKKRRSGKQKFVLLSRPGSPQITDRIEKKLVRVAVNEMINKYNRFRGDHE